MCLSLQKAIEMEAQKNEAGSLQGGVGCRTAGESDTSLSLPFCVVLTCESVLTFYLFKKI